MGNVKIDTSFDEQLGYVLSSSVARLERDMHLLEGVSEYLWSCHLKQYTSAVHSARELMKEVKELIEAHERRGNAK